MHLIVGLLFMLVVVVLPGWWVKRVMQRYSHPVDRYPGTGAELARHLLDHCGLEAVVVGIENLGERRVDEYAPFEEPDLGGGGADDYLDLVAGPVRALVDGAFRTRAGPESRSRRRR